MRFACKKLHSQPKIILKTTRVSHHTQGDRGCGKGRNEAITTVGCDILESHSIKVHPQYIQTPLLSHLSEDNDIKETLCLSCIIVILVTRLVDAGRSWRVKTHSSSSEERYHVAESIPHNNGFDTVQI